MLVNFLFRPDDPRELVKTILRELAVQLNAGIRRALGPIRRKVRDTVERALRASPEFDSLAGGRLQAELGVADSLSAMRAIADAIVGVSEVTHQPVSVSGENLTGGLTVSVLRTDLGEVLAIPGATFTSEGGYQIDWLDWLLTKGDQFIIAEYVFVPGEHPGSRTGLGIMAKAQQGGWRVPPEFAGTINDNWLTRSLGGAEPAIAEIIQQELLRVL